MHPGATTRAPAKRGSPRLRWMLLGDWTPLIRDPTDLLRLAFLVGMFIELAGENWSGALRLFLTFLVCLIPRLIATPQVFDFAFNVAMSLQAWGNVGGAFETWLPYHDIVHCLLTMATAALFYFVLVRLRLVPDLARRRSARQGLGIAVLTFAIGSLVGAVYEEYEWFAINYMHAHLIEYYTHDIADLAFNGLGSLGAAALLALWARRGWDTRRPERGDPLPGLMAGLERRMARSARDPHARRRRFAHLDRGDRPPPAPHLPGFVAHDWTPLIRDPIDLLRLSFFVGIWVSLGGGQGDISVRFAITFLVSLAARWIDPPRPFDFAFNLALAFQAWGDYAGAFNAGSAYQDWTYVLVALSSAIMLYLALLRLRVFPDFADAAGVHRRVAVFLAAMSLGYSVGVYYALYIYGANAVLGASFPVGWNLLTLHLALDWLGAMLGAGVLVAWDIYGWANRRRLSPTTLSRARASHPA
ncbi:MAG TPA: hypothetical protein VJU60_04505 [Thermoleophilaceae bacterium]|nr:hypothetical protein [Thermoleophilaceae bacterium]